ncbi:MAG: HD domain-containing phosphohydrolase [bacterium]
MRTARILLVEPEETARRDLNRCLERAGHEVACVADEDGARLLMADGLDPDVVLAQTSPGVDADRSLRAMAPRAAHMRIVQGREGSDRKNDVEDDPTLCSRDPEDVLRRIEEVLLEAEPRAFPDSPTRCLDLVRRLASALPRARTPEERVDIVVEAFDTYFGVLGTLVVRRGQTPDDWIEARQGLDRSLALRISQEIARRAVRRGLRPFLTRFEHEGEMHEIAGLAVQSGDVETDLALALDDPPSSPELRESLISLVGSSLRSAMMTDDLEHTRTRLDAQSRSFSSLLELSREFARVGTRRLLCEAILRAVHRELQMSRSALFLPRAEGEAMLAPHAVAGFLPVLLDRIGLSGAHGVGAMCFEATGVKRLAAFPADGVAARELRMLHDAGLQWAVSLRIDGRPNGVLLFGSREEAPDLEPGEVEALQSLLEAAAFALRGLERVEGLRDLAVCSLQGLVAAAEIRRPQDRGHAERVARGAVAVGRAIGLAPKELRDLVLAALLHDVGKVAMTPETSEGAAEEGRLRMHPVVGSRILSRARPAPAVVHGVEQHHERWDGHGFPYGLKGADIHLFARILAIANAYDRWLPAGDAPPADDALHRLELGAGLLFDPGLVAVFSSEVGRAPASDSRREEWLEDIVAAP